MPAKRGIVNVEIGINLSTDAVGKPIAIAPDIWYGVNDKLTVGLIHSVVGATGVQGLQGIAGTGLCLTGEDNGCGKFYDFVGIDARYTLKQDAKLALALDGGLFATSFDPFQLALKVGVTGRYKLGEKLGLEFAPNIFFGVTERDGGGTVGASTNKETLALPVGVGFGLNDKISLLAQLALTLPFEDAGDLYTLGLALGGSYAVNKQLSIRLGFALPILVTGLKDAMGDSVGGVDFRSLTLGGSYAF